MLSCTDRTCHSGSPSNQEDLIYSRPPTSRAVELAWKRDLLDLETRLLESFNTRWKELRLLIDAKVSHEELRVQLEPLAAQQVSVENTQSVQRRELEELAAKLDNNSALRAKSAEQAAIAQRQFSSEEEVRQLYQTISAELRQLNQVWEAPAAVKAVNNATPRSLSVMCERENSVTSDGRQVKIVDTSNELLQAMEPKNNAMDANFEGQRDADVIAPAESDAPRKEDTSDDCAKSLGVPEAVREVAPSIWEAAVLAGMPHVPIVAYGMLVIGLLFNALCQFLFITIIASQFRDPTLPEVDALEDWRISAHDVNAVDPKTGSSLVARVCKVDEALQVATVQSDVLNSWKVYLDPLPLPGDMSTGPTLFLLSWGMWFMCAFTEASDAISFLCVCFNLPRGDSSRGSLNLDATDGTYKITSISLPRLFFVLLLTCCRVVIAVVLGVVGSLWLANQFEVEDLVLNAAALGFVMDLDEFIFDVFAPACIHVIVANMEPMTFTKHAHPVLHWILDTMGVRPFAFSTLGVSAIAVLMSTKIKDNIDTLTEMEETLCGGNQDFATSLDMRTGFLLARETMPYTSNVDNLFAVRLKTAFKELRNRNPYTPVEDLLNFTAFITPNLQTFNQFAYGTMEEHAYAIGYGLPDCDSTRYDVFGKGFPNYVANALRFVSGISDARGCLDLASMCHDKGMSILRVFCPSQCGCASPVSGLYLGGPSMGCPRQKCREAPTWVQTIDFTACADPTPEQLRKMPGWIRYWDEFAKVESRGNGGFFEWRESGFDAFDADRTADVAKQAGCDVIRHSPQLVFSFCFETDTINSLMTFCPETCGCRMKPHLPGCPKDCNNYIWKYEMQLRELPCTDLTRGYQLNTSHYITQFQIQVYLNYRKEWRNFVLQSFMHGFDFLTLWGIINVTGCDPGVHIGEMPIVNFCSSTWASYDIQALCPQMCACRETGSPGCPDSCLTPMTLDQLMLMLDDEAQDDSEDE